MQAVLNVKTTDINDNLLNVIKELLSRDVEIVIKKTVELEEFDERNSLDDIMRKFGEVGYSGEFLKDLKAGFETSEIYT